MDLKADLPKNSFLAMMNHEMRTPLNAILGMCSIAQNTNDPGKIDECLVKINEASLHLLGMINNVLDLTKIETENLKLVNEEFRLKGMLNKAAETVKFIMDAKKQNLCLDLDPDLPETIVTDEQRLTQTLENILENAAKFTPPEGTITLSVKKLSEESQHCTLGVRIDDTGIGIQRNELKNIFHSFEQVDKGTTRKYGGLGIGLSLSASIIHLMGGEIQVDSKPGKGSSFSFEITVEKGKDPLFMAGDSAADSIGSFQGKTIMLAEDVEINREIVLSFLENSGITIECAVNGAEALDKYKASPSKYSLILMDIHMPEMDGFEATRQIRALEEELTAKNDLKFPKETSKLLLERPQGVPIIAMTANVFKDDVDKCLATGMTSHLGKPIDYTELMKQLNKYLCDS